MVAAEERPDMSHLFASRGAIIGNYCHTPHVHMFMWLKTLFLRNVFKLE